MELSDFLALIKQKKQTICSLVVIFLIVSIILTAIQPFKYSSNLKLLVFQTTSQTNLDPYAITRSNEYLSGVLAKITQSNSFYNRVVNSDFAIDEEYFGQTPKQQSKKWINTVNAKTIGDTGIISITAYHTNRQQAEQIARAVGHVLMTQHVNYHGLSNNVKIKLLDEPITSNYPVRPNIILNIILALVLGLVFSLAYIYLLPDKKYDIRLFTRQVKLPPEQEGELPKANSNSQADREVIGATEDSVATEASVADVAKNPEPDWTETMPTPESDWSTPVETAESFGKFDDDWFDVADNKKFDPFK